VKALGIETWQIDSKSLGLQGYSEMQQLDVNQTILIVVGADITPEEKDRPIAYRLKQYIEQSPLYGSLPFRKCIVISDLLFENDKIIQICPTISIGGPGVNALVARMVEKLPVYHAESDQYFIQYDENGPNNLICIWGMDQKMTEMAVDWLINNGLLDKFLKKIWT
jgi:hypothetical protein